MEDINTKEYIMEDINTKEYKCFIKNLNNTEIEILGNDYTSCWLFAYYIHKN